jgi:hypothetical protein
MPGSSVTHSRITDRTVRCPSGSHRTGTGRRSSTWPLRSRDSSSAGYRIHTPEVWCAAARTASPPTPFELVTATADVENGWRSTQSYGSREPPVVGTSYVTAIVAPRDQPGLCVDARELGRLLRHMSEAGPSLQNRQVRPAAIPAQEAVAQRIRRVHRPLPGAGDVRRTGDPVPHRWECSHLHVRTASLTRSRMVSASRMRRPTFGSARSRPMAAASTIG